MVVAAKVSWFVRNVSVVVDLDQTQRERTVVRRLPRRQLDELIAEDGAARGHGAPLDHLVAGVVLEPSDEEDVLGRQLSEPRVVDVAAVHDDHRPGIEA